MKTLTPSLFELRSTIPWREKHNKRHKMLHFLQSQSGILLRVINSYTWLQQNTLFQDSYNFYIYHRAVKKIIPKHTIAEQHGQLTLSLAITLTGQNQIPNQAIQEQHILKCSHPSTYYQQGAIDHLSQRICLCYTLFISSI